MQETIDIVRQHGGIGVIVDPSGSAEPDLGCPFVSLIKMNVAIFPGDKIPHNLTAVPAIKPGSK